jgi:hypothetical protein
MNVNFVNISVLFAILKLISAHFANPDTKLLTKYVKNVKISRIATYVSQVNIQLDGIVYPVAIIALLVLVIQYAYHVKMAFSLIQKHFNAIILTANILFKTKI